MSTEASNNTPAPAEGSNNNTTVNATQPPQEQQQALANGADIEMNGTTTTPTNNTANTANSTAEQEREKQRQKEKERKEEETRLKEQQDKAEEDMNRLFAARREEETARRDRSLAEFLVMLDGYKPLIPEEVTEYYLQRSGFECSDPRLKRLLSLSAQKFVSDLSRDAYHFAKLRVNGTAPGRGRPSAASDRNKVSLTMDDLSLALGEHGVNVNKPDYYL